MILWIILISIEVECYIIIEEYVIYGVVMIKNKFLFVILWINFYLFYYVIGLSLIEVFDDWLFFYFVFEIFSFCKVEVIVLYLGF